MTNTRGAERGVRGQMKTIYSNITVAAAGNQVSYKQYVRLGETLSNGYTLVEVNAPVPEEAIERLAALEHVRRVRVIAPSA